MLKKCFVLLLVAVSAGAGLSYWGWQQIVSYVASPIKLQEDTMITVLPGSNYYSFTRQLIDLGIINDSPWARLSAKFFPELSHLKKGTYLLTPNMQLSHVFELIRSGKEYQFAVTFVEGSTFSDWREKMTHLPYLQQKTREMTQAQIAEKLQIKHPSLEGLMLPETYHYIAGDTDLSLLRRAAKAQEKVLAEAWQSRAKNLPLKTEYELLTLASIIEKETAQKKERSKVASVFINRLNKGMRLQTDPTVIYGMGDAYTGDIRKKDLRNPTPYNTYIINGLPPTPIAMPSKAAIFAAAQPEITPYFYFVADGSGGHQFSVTLKEHNQAVQKYLALNKKQHQ